MNVDDANPYRAPQTAPLERAVPADRPRLPAIVRFLLGAGAGIAALALLGFAVAILIAVS